MARQEGHEAAGVVMVVRIKRGSISSHRRQLRWLKDTVLLLCAFALLSSSVHLYGQTEGGRGGLPPTAAAAPSQQPAQPQAPLTAAQDQAIPLAEVANRAEELDRQLRDLSKALSPSAQLVTTDRVIREQTKEINERAQRAADLAASTPSPVELQEEDRYWGGLSQQYASFRKLLTTSAAKLEENIRLLDATKAQWRATMDKIRKQKGIKPVIERVAAALKAIDDVRGRTQTELDRILNLQTQQSEREQRISQVLATLEETRQRLRGRLLVQDAEPIWKVHKAGAPSESVASVAYRSLSRGLTGSGEFLRANKLRTVLCVLLYVAALMLVLKFRHNERAGVPVDIPPEASRMLSHPYSVALLVALLGTVGEMAAAPPAILFTVYVLYSLQMVRLIPLLTTPRVLPLLYTLAALCLLEGLYVLVQASALVRRELLTVIVFMALVCLGWLTRPSVLREWRASARAMFVIVAAARAGFVLLGLSLLANILGYVSLAHVLGTTGLLGTFVAILLFGAVRVLRLMLTLALHSWAKSLSTTSRRSLEGWGGWVLSLSAFFVWLNAVLYFLTVHDSVAKAFAGILKYPLGFDKLRVTLGDVLSFLLVLLVGYILANALTQILREALLSSSRMQRGLPHAISTILYYLMLIVVFMAALVEAGIELNKFTVVSGALGLGVGFGLQNTVNNFVSGLMLLFERPVRVGDTIEVAGISGTVKRIGVRSCTIQTGQEAEVIVPNSNLISNQVTNWTLSSHRRRADIPVAVAHGTDPEAVLALLVSVASSYDGVLSNPGPEAFFLGFGESALNFELRFWASHERWFRLRSDVTIGICRALRDAKIEIALPQRDLHLRSIDETARAAISLAPPGAKLPKAEEGRKAAGTAQAG